MSVARHPGNAAESPQSSDPGSALCFGRGPSLSGLPGAHGPERAGPCTRPSLRPRAQHSIWQQWLAVTLVAAQAVPRPGLPAQREECGAEAQGCDGAGFRPSPLLTKISSTCSLCLC